MNQAAIRLRFAIPCLFFVLLAGCEERNRYAAPPPSKVTVEKPEVRDVQEYFKTVGQTQAMKRVELRARVSGYLDGIEFADGEVVQESQLLFTIDRAPYDAAVKSAEATLAKAKANLKLAEQRLARAVPLVPQQAVTESELDQIVAERESAAADVESAEAALREARLNLDYTEIRAPFTGRIGRHRVDVGNLVEPATTLLAIIESVDPMHAYFTVSESDLLHYLEMRRTGELKLKDNDQIPVELSIGDQQEFRFHGYIDYREFGVDPATGTTERRAIFPNKDTELRPGLFVQVRIPVGPPVPRMLVEERAIGTDQRGDYLLVVNEKNKVEHRTVTLGQQEDEMRVILDGVAKDDRVIVEGLQRARPGSEVLPEDLAAAEQAVTRTAPAPTGQPSTSERVE